MQKFYYVENHSNLVKKLFSRRNNKKKNNPKFFKISNFYIFGGFLFVCFKLFIVIVFLNLLYVQI